eukprot:Em0002g1391a
MSTIAAKSLKIPNVRAEKGSGTRKADLKTGPTEQLGTNGENTTNLVTRQSSTTSSSTSPDHEAGTNGTPATTPRPVSVTKTVGGSTKPAGSAPSRALRSPLSKINVTSKNSKRPEGGDGRADPLPAKASQSKTKPAATPPASDHLSKSHKGASVPTSDVTGSGFPRAAGVSRQGVPSLAATRVGSAPVPTRGAGGASRAAPAKKAATGAAAKVRESHKLEYPQSSLSENGVTPTTSSVQEPRSDVSGPESIPNGLDLGPKEMDPQPVPTEPGSNPTEPKPKPIEPAPAPKEPEPSVQWVALTEERDRLAKALADKEAEFRAREADLLGKLRAASSVTQAVEPCLTGVEDSVDGAVETEGEVAQSDGQGGVIQNARDTAASVTSTSCKDDDDESESKAAQLKMGELEAIQKEREMVILRGEQEIARLQLELQTSEDQLAQCRRELELTQSRLKEAEEKLCHAGSAHSGTLRISTGGDIKAGPSQHKSTRHDNLGINGNQTYHHSLDHTDERSNGHDVSRENQQTDESLTTKGFAKPTSALVQWCKALLSDDQEGVELPVGAGEEEALLEVIKEYQERTREKLRAMEERYQHDLTASEEVIEVKGGSKGKLFRSDGDSVSTEQDIAIKRIKPGDDLAPVPPSSRLVKKARRRSGGNGSVSRPRSLDGPQATSPPASTGPGNAADTDPSMPPPI